MIYASLPISEMYNIKIILEIKPQDQPTANCGYKNFRSLVLPQNTQRNYHKKAMQVRPMECVG